MCYSDSIVIRDMSGEIIDTADDIESAECVLYGDLSYHDGEPRLVTCGRQFYPALKTLAEINSDCFGIPLDVVEERK